MRQAHAVSEGGSGGRMAERPDGMQRFYQQGQGSSSEQSVTGGFFKFLAFLGGLAIAGWACVTIRMLVYVIASGCLTGPDPRVICGDVNRAAFFVSAFVGVFALPIGFLLILPALVRKARKG